jgi:hypothetical protein
MNIPEWKFTTLFMVMGKAQTEAQLPEQPDIMPVALALFK